MDISQIDDFWSAFRPIIFVAQLFTLFPVEGVFAREAERINFHWVSWRTLVSLLFLVLGALVIIAQLNHVVCSHATPSRITEALYYILNFSGAVCFFVIAMRWQTVILNWRMYEEVFLYVPYKQLGRSLKFKVRFVGFIVLLLALLEDLLHISSCFESNYEYLSRCDNGSAFWQTFYEREHPQIFQYIEYSLPMAILVEYTHKVYLFLWTFMDLFITLVSLGLSTRFEQLYSRIEHLKGKSMPDSFWVEIRLDYSRISNLVAFIDKVLSPIILITCASDIYFITYQLYMSVKLNASMPLSTLYYRLSLVFLIFRALLMLLTSSHIFVASQKPLGILRAVPMSSWTTNVQRFTHEILNIQNALSGHKFFFLKRQIILAMAGTLLTYELVMLSEVKSTDDAEFCDRPTRLY
ncbi:gustatory receptor for sugar taste 64a-like [Toxorhynchites rutilus septentrionalis]|uniref:gustatory receptor for sugar taste 64a-like n=1 Tax=Toxorhynchites rutilus septentrionalis TaxID=329112 RepID=UPI00247A71BB|nr:gustatory receptor for sugar taste 64a-like [Toxorhynchites rutilus septentrionalis]